MPKELLIDLENRTITNKDLNKKYNFTSKEGFDLISEIWLNAGWDTKYVYGFTWLNRPIIQQPEDMFRIQELICKIKPDYIIETGIAHGGSLIFYASLCYLNRKGKVIGIDNEIRPHNRVKIENHELYSYITMYESDSTNALTIEKIKNKLSYHKIIKNKEPTILVILDSNHTKEHVLKELNLYSRFVSKDSYIIVCDGHIKSLVGKYNAPRSEKDWITNNPNSAVLEFLENNKNFILEEPKPIFNETNIYKWTSYFTGGFLRRII